VYIYALSSAWEVDHIYRATLSVIMPASKQQRGYERSMRYRMFTEMPDVMPRGGTYYDDVIKVIVTSHWTEFDIWEQPSIWDIRDCTSGIRDPLDESRGIEKWSAYSFRIRTWI
jgi:hypothetical protein